MALGRDKKTGRFISKGKTIPKCIKCGSPISSTSYYYGSKKCQDCYFEDKKKKPKKGRTPNVECYLCGEPLYRSPSAIKKSKSKKFACSECRGEARKDIIKNNPKIYKAMLKKAKKKGEENIHWKGGVKPCPICGGEKGRYSSVCENCFEYPMGEDHWNFGKQGLGGEDHWNWQGGLTSENRRQRIKFKNTMQKTIFERDDYTCQLCGKKGGYLQVDHIKDWADYPDLRFKEDNCRTLCMSCHYKETFGREMPEDISTWGHNLCHQPIKSEQEYLS